MKLLLSIRRELVLLSRSIYFYVELITTAVFLIVLLLLLPEHLDTRITEYYWLSGSAVEAAELEAYYFGSNDEMVRDNITLNIAGTEKTVRRYTEDMKYLILVDSREDLIALTEQSGNVGIVIGSPSGGGAAFTYYLQGYETERYKSYAALLAGGDFREVTAAAQARGLQILQNEPVLLNNRQSALPLMLTLNCVLMGILVAAAYIVEDKKTNTIKALRVAPAGVAGYLLAKVAAVLLTSLVTCLVIAVPVMGGMANYPLLVLVVMCAGFFSSSLGALIASFYSDMSKAFAAVYIVLMLLLVPAISGFVPGWNPAWLKIIPSYYVLQGVRDALMDREALSVIAVCGGYAPAGALLLALAARRYKTIGIGG